MNNFRLRSFVSFSLVFSFCAAAVSGIVLYLRPEGGLARWMDWHCLGLDKKQWESIHILFVAAVIVLVIGHLRYNWKMLIAYIQNKTNLVKGSIQELLIALLCLVAFFFLALLQLPPASLLIHLRSEIKNGVYTLHTRPPVPDADQLTIKELSGVCNIPEEELFSRMARLGISADTAMTLGIIAAQNRISPQTLYAKLIEK